jgi:hypothetical protein
MSLFDRYDQNEAELFLRDTCFIPTPQRRFEDLFDQIHQHFQHMQIFIIVMILYDLKKRQLKILIN